MFSTHNAIENARKYEKKKKKQHTSPRTTTAIEHMKCVSCAVTNANQNKTDKRQKQHERTKNEEKKKVN